MSTHEQLLDNEGRPSCIISSINGRFPRQAQPDIGAADPRHPNTCTRSKTPDPKESRIDADADGHAGDCSEIDEFGCIKPNAGSSLSKLDL